MSQRRPLCGALRTAVCACALMLFAACSSGPPAVRYLLEPAAVTDANTAGVGVSSIGLRTISVPGYVEESAITIRGDGARLIIDESAHWAEVPEAALTRTLAESLRLRTHADVLTEPLPRGFDPGVRVEVVFDRLLAQTGGVADLTGQVSLISGDGRDLLKVLPFQLLQRGRGGDYDGFFEAVSVSIDDLARLIVDLLQAQS